MNRESMVCVRPTLGSMALWMCPAALFGGLPLLVLAETGDWALLQALVWRWLALLALLSALGSLMVWRVQIRLSRRGIAAPAGVFERAFITWDDISSIAILQDCVWPPRVEIRAQEQRVVLPLGHRRWLVRSLAELAVPHPRAKELFFLLRG